MSVTQPLKVYHDGSVRDISAVGNRDVGCSHGLDGYSPAAQFDLGQSYAHKLESKYKLLADPILNDYVNRVGQNLVLNSDAKFPFTIRIIDSDDVNAFSLPGGFVFVDSGLILALDNEAELAAVMSHEIAHVAACHAAQEMAREDLTSIASMPLILRLLLRRFTVNTSYLENRRFESEADFLGVEYLYKSGYDPQALASFFEKVKLVENRKRGREGRGFESHPQLTERINRVQQEISTILPPAPEYKEDSSDFQDAKARLYTLKNGTK